MRNVTRFLAPVGLLAALGCGSDLKGELIPGSSDGDDPLGMADLYVSNPEDGAYYASQLVVVKGLTSIDGEVLVNGEATLATEGMFSHTLRLREEGSHTITVEVPELNVERELTITVDTVPPRITLTKPEAGAFIEGTAIEVAGMVEDENVDVVSINNRDYGVRSDGTFSGLVDVDEGAHHWRVEASDLAGNVTPSSVSFLAGNFSSNGSTTPEAVTLELGDDMVSAIGKRIEPELTPARIRSALGAANPVVNEWYGTVTLDGYSHREVSVALRPQDSYLSASISVGNLSVPFSFNPAVGDKIRGYATCVAVNITGRVYLGVDANGRPTADLRNLSSTLIGFGIDIRGWPNEFDEFVTQRLRSTLEDAVKDVLRSKAPPAVRAILSGLPVQGEFSVLEHQAHVSGRLSELSVTSAGLFASIDLGVEAAAPQAALANRSGPFTIGHKNPSTTGTSDTFLRVALDLVNRALHAAWTTGGLKHTVESPVLPGDNPTEITVGTLSLLFPSIKGIAPDDQAIDLQIEAALPPIVRQEASQAVIAAPDVRVKFVAKDGSNRTPLFDLSVLARAHINFNLGGNTLTAKIANYDIVIDAFGDVPAGFQSGEELQDLFEKLLLPKIEPYLQLEPLMIPKIPGYQIEAESAELSEGYLEAKGKLVLE